jgi:hypothetical protein
MERRSDMLIGSLRNTITAMGGELEIRVRFPDGDVVRINFDDELESRNEPPLSEDDKFALGA